MPCDGTLCLAGAILSSGEAIQAKGISYGTHSLVFGSGPIDPNFIPTFFATIYLAPHNYHRVHSPVTGTLRAIRYIPGRLLPVNRLFAGLCPALFTENERMVFDIRTPQGGTIKVVMVGAFNVGRIHSPFWPEMNTNNFERQWDGRIGHQEICYSFPVSAGDELGVFMLGSTTVMVFDKIAAKAYTLEARNEPSTVRLGELFARSNHSKGDPGEVD
jgi:phosphatidylserine decarboxylase